jgi:hypothetical protein
MNMHEHAANMTNTNMSDTRFQRGERKYVGRGAAAECGGSYD